MTHEIVSYRFRTDVPQADALRVVHSLDAFLESRAGFLSRHVLYDEAQRTWLDIVEWASLEEAQAAAAAFGGSPDGAAFMALAEPESVQMFHARTVQQAAAREAPLSAAH